MAKADEKPEEKVKASDKKLKTTAVIQISGEDVVVKKLKARQFYELQKIFSEIIAAVSPKGTEKAESLDNMSGVFVTYPDKVASFVALCISWDKKKLLDEAYPEEINSAFATCLELNNVTENVKNSVAPMNKIGAEVL